MRRLRQDETFHGTGIGQIAIDRSLVAEFDLTEREAVCAGLLEQGLSVSSIARTLAISTSTAEKHLLGVRRKLGVTSTVEAVVLLLRREVEGTARITDGFGERPIVETGDPCPSNAEHVAALRSARTLADLLRESLRALRGDGAQALSYFFLPLSAASFRSGDVISESVGNESVVNAFGSNAGWFAAEIANRLFAEPDRSVVVDADGPLGQAGIEMPDSLRAACREQGIRYGITLGAPYGTGYFVYSTLYHTMPRPVFCRELPARIDRLRREMALSQNAAFSYGALAQRVGLTIRERDALALLAEGCAGREAANSMGISERAFAELLKRARTKLRAPTTASSIAKAMALNALVFLS